MKKNSAMTYNKMPIKYQIYIMVNFRELTNTKQTNKHK